MKLLMLIMDISTITCVLNTFSIQHDVMQQVHILWFFCQSQGTIAFLPMRNRSLRCRIIFFYLRNLIIPPLIPLSATFQGALQPPVMFLLFEICSRNP